MSSSAHRPPTLLVDDDPLILDSLSFVLQTEFQVTTATNRIQALELLQSGLVPEIALIDLGLPPHPHSPEEGFALITELLARAPAIRIVVLSGQNDDANARHARALGALDFVAKPVKPDELRKLLHGIARLAQVAVPPTPTDATGLIGQSPPVVRLRQQLGQFAASSFPVLIEGESGTGKELAARALHVLSPRSGQPFLALNCAAIAPTLVEATLFGHARGAFTGAAAARAGYFEEAGTGTLFLDEIGELPLELQPKLLRVLENGEYQRIGETQVRQATTRIVAATNRDLRTEVHAGRFRADLFHRLSVLSIAMPALRDLGNDRLTLFDHFNHLCAQQTGAPVVRLGADARDRLAAYAFPGNVRELRNIAIRLNAKYPGSEISAGMLDDELDITVLDSSQPAAVATHDAPATDPIERAMRHLQSHDGFVLDTELKRIEAEYIEAAQRLAAGNFSQAARLLGLSRTTLYSRMEALLRNRST